MAEIEIRQLAKVYPGGIDALKPIDLTVGTGELLVVLGPSGSGKTTLVRLIAGLETPSSGSVWIDGRDVSRVPPHRRDVAMVFQNPALYPHLSVFDNLAFGLRARGVSRGQARARVNTLAGMLGLDRVLARRPGALSGGERQRVAIGRAAGAAAANDLVRRAVFESRRAAAGRAARASRRASSPVRNDLDPRHARSGRGTAHGAIGLSCSTAGQLLQCGTPRAVYDRPAHRFVATFVGSPPMNILPCQIEHDDETIRVHPFETDRTLALDRPRVAASGLGGNNPAI